MGFFRRKRAEPSGEGGPYTPEEIRSEWFDGSLRDDVADLRSWRHGLRQYEAAVDGDVDAHRAAGFEMARGLRHHLSRDDFLPPASAGEPFDFWLLTTVYEMGMASFIWRDEQTFSTDDERLLRLSVAVIGRYGLEPAFLGGNGQLGDLFEIPTFHMLANLVVAPEGRRATLTHFFPQFGAAATFVGNGSPL